MPRASCSMDNSFFEIGVAYTRREIYRILGGDLLSNLPTQGEKVVYCCISHYINPAAPDVILVGRQGRMQASAKQLARQGNVIPVFMRQSTKRTEKLVYQGEFVAERYSENWEEIHYFARKAYRVDVVALLYLTRLT